MRIVAALVVTVALAGCGSSNSSTSGGDTAVRAAAQAYSDAYLTGDGDTAFGLLSTRCQDQLGRGPFTALVTAAGKTYGQALPFSTFAADVQGDQARLTYTYDSTPAINQKDQPWSEESGHWHYDAC